MSRMRSTNQQLNCTTSKVAVLMASNDTNSYSIMIDSCQQQKNRLLHSSTTRPAHTSHGQSRAETSGQSFLQSKKCPTESKKTTVECRKRDEQVISLTETDIDKFFQWQWNRICEMSNEEAFFFPTESGKKEQQPVQPPQAVEALYFHLKAKEAGSCYWADQFLLLVGRNLDVISKDPDFLCLDLVTVCKILNSDYLDVRREKDVFNAGHRWIRADFDYRLQHANEVLSCTRYAFMTPEEIVRCVFCLRSLTDIVLNIPEYPQALLRGIIGKYLIDLGMKSNYREFEVHERFTMGDSCTPFSDPNGGKGPVSKSVFCNQSIDSKQKPSQNGSINMCSCLSVHTQPCTK